MHESDRMATEKLDEGIKGFSKALETLENLLAARLTELTESDSSAAKARDDQFDLFKAYDLDGDGFITREEWLGTDAAFDALDLDHDGKLSSSEIVAGLGPAFEVA
jgi:transaldolase